MTNPTTNNTKKKIVIIGGGFAGINLARQLLRYSQFQITLVDRNNYNFFPPLLYQVATGFLETSNISYPFRKLFRKNDNIQFRLAEFLKVDPLRQICFLDNGEIGYDFLVFATGTTNNYFGNDNIKRNAIPMKTLNDALNMRNILLQRLEQACITDNPVEKKKLLTIVVAGGGPTGVEVSGMLAELRKYIIRKDYPELKGTQNDIYLLDGAPQLLIQMSGKSQQETYNALTKLGVKIKLNTLVMDFNNDRVVLSNGEIIEAKTLIWAAGVVAKIVDGIPAACIGPGKRMITDEYNKVIDLTGIYAIGDTCIDRSDPAFPNGHPQLAQTAIQQGQNLARNFDAMTTGKPLKKFRYFDKGTMAIVGRNRAVADLFRAKFHVGGFIALLIWLFIHIMGLIKYPNKIKTFYNWVTAYLTKDQPLRMIIRPAKESAANHSEI